MFIVLGGPNGSGKSTIAKRLVFDTCGVRRFLNADTIARGLAAYGPELAAVSAGRVMLEETDRLIADRDSLAVESTLSGRVWANRLKGPLRDGGYRTHLGFVYTRAPDENVSRVAARVATGGHHIPEHDIRRRYVRALNNFFRLYAPLVETWEVHDNTDGDPVLVAHRDLDGRTTVHDAVEWTRRRRMEQTGDDLCMIPRTP